MTKEESRRAFGLNKAFFFFYRVEFGMVKELYWRSVTAMSNKDAYG